VSDATLDINNPEQIEEVVSEARATFNLKDRLQGLSKRTAEVTVYTDEVLGEKHAKLKTEIDGLKGLINPIEGVNLSQEVIDTTEAEIAKYQPALDAARKELERTAMVFSLRAVPPIAEKVIARDVRKALGIKGKVPEDRVEDWVEAYNARLLAQQIVGFEDRESGTISTSVTVDDALALEGFLPKYEYAKLKNVADDLQLRNTIGELAVDDADFSQAG
jgi:vacuolar-type H+-ATPase subunit I/STV1